MTTKIRVDSCNDQHCRFTVFTGVDAEHLQNAGSLCMSPQQYLLFAVAVSLGKDVMKGHFNFIIEEDKYIAWAKTIEE